MSMFSLKKLALVAFVGAGMTLSGCLTNDDKDEEKPPVDSTTALPAEKTINVGAQGHASLGSAVDLDEGKVLLSAAANAALETVDLVFMYYGTSYHIDNTTSAKAAGKANSITLTDTYPDAKLSTNKFVKVTAKPSSQEDAKAKFTASTSKLSSSPIANGDMFIVETTEADHVLLTVSATTGSDKNGAADFKISVTPF
jgi:flagellar hook protein FlgE